MNCFKESYIQQLDHLLKVPFQLILHFFGFKEYYLIYSAML